MNKKVTDWLSKSDEEFLAKLKDEQSRKEFLGELHRKKVLFLAIFCLMIIFLFAIAISSGDSLEYIFFFILVWQYVGYLDNESKIRSIRLYELSITTDGK